MFKVPVYIYNGLPRPSNNDLWSEMRRLPCSGMTHRPDDMTHRPCHDRRAALDKFAQPYWACPSDHVGSHLETVVNRQCDPVSIFPDCCLVSPDRFHPSRDIGQRVFGKLLRNFDANKNYESRRDHVPDKGSDIETEGHSTEESNSDHILRILENALKKRLNVNICQDAHDQYAHHDILQDTPQNAHQDTPKDTHQAIPQDVSQNKPRRWRHAVDCAEFGPNNIFVKILNGRVIVRGVKEESSQNGFISTTNIEKNIQLPKNVISEKVRCKILPDLKLIIEAPVVQEHNQNGLFSRKANDETKIPIKSKSVTGAISTVHDVKENEVCDLRYGQCTEQVLEAGKKINNETQECGLEVTKDQNDEESGRYQQPESVGVFDDDDGSYSVTSQKTDNSFVILGDEESTENVKEYVTTESALNESPQTTCTVNYSINPEVMIDKKPDTNKLTYSGKTMIPTSEMHISSDKTEQSENHDEFTISEEHSTAEDQTVSQAAVDSEVDTHNQQENKSFSEDAAPSCESDLPQKEFQVNLEFPCHSPETIRVTMDDHRRILHILAGKDGDSAADRVHKVVPVPETVNDLKLKCHFQDGRLRISAPLKLSTGTIRDIRVVM